MRNNHIISDFITVAHFKEIHSIPVPSSAEKCWSALRMFELADSKLISLLFILRGLKLPTISSSKKHEWSASWLSFFISGFQPIIIHPPFTLMMWLGLTHPVIKAFPHQEKLLRLAQRLSRNNLLNKSKLQMRILQLDQNVDIGWDFQIFPLTKNQCILSTETRVYFRLKRYKNLFTPYWILIRLFSGAIRLEMLRVIRKNAIKKHEEGNFSL